MLRPVRLADQWREILGSLPEGWSDARLSLTVAEAGRADEAAALLGSLMPGRRGSRISFYAARGGAGPSAEAIARGLKRLDEAGIAADLELLASGEPVTTAPTSRATLAASWDAEVAALPRDWSDAYAELELNSTDYLERAALLCAPLTPARHAGKPAFRFRAARRFGYGTAAGMVRRCLERLDEEGIRGEVRVLRALSETDPVATQGPVWYVGGRAV